MIAITDGNSQFGRLVVKHLLTRVPPSEVAVTVEDPAQVADLAALGVRVWREDFDDRCAALEIFSGVDRVLSNPRPGWIASETPGGSAEKAQMRINAASSAGVSYLAHIGIINNDQTHQKWQNDLDFRVRTSGIPYTILRNNLHTESLLPAVHLALATGEFVCSFGGQAIAAAALTDYAEAAAVVLTEGGHENKVWELSGWALTALGIASVIEMVGDRHIRLREIDATCLTAELKQAGATDQVAADLQSLYRAVDLGEFSTETDTLDQLLGRRHLSNVDAICAALQTQPVVEPHR